MSSKPATEVTSDELAVGTPTAIGPPTTFNPMVLARTDAWMSWGKPAPTSPIDRKRLLKEEVGPDATCTVGELPPGV